MANSLERALAIESIRGFVHPAVTIDQAGRPTLTQPHDTVVAAHVFAQLVGWCLPMQAGGAEHGYAKFLALAFRALPDQFEGLTYEDVASWLGVSRFSFARQLQAIESELASQAKISAPTPPGMGFVCSPGGSATH